MSAPTMPTRQVTELCKIHLDLHTPDWDPEILSRCEPDQIAKTLATAGIRVLYFFAKDHYGNAYYNTRVGKKHLCLGSRDLLGEMIESAKTHGIDVVAYYSAFQDNHIASQHPDWQIRTLPERPPSNWLWVCPNRPEYVHYCCAMLSEVIDGYDIAGLHIDMLNYDFNLFSCYCPACQSLFQEQYGQELPTDSNDRALWLRFLDFRYDSVERYATTLRKTIKEARPELPVVFNYHGSPGFDWRVGQKPVRHTLYSDLGTGETYLPLFGAMYPGLEVRYVRNLQPGRPFEMVPWRMNRITDYTLKPMAQMRWEAFVSLAGGASLMMIDQPFHDGRLDEIPYLQIAGLTREIEQKRHLFAGVHQRHVGIYYSVRTRDFLSPRRNPEFMMPVMGAYKALVESHYLVDFIFDETATSDLLNQYKVIVLPNVMVMSDAEANMLREWVRQGGTLISTSETGMYDDEERSREDFVLQDVLGLSYQRKLDTDSTFAKGVSGRLGHDIPPGLHILNLGPIVSVIAKEAGGSGQLLESFHKQEFPDRFFSHGIHPPAKSTGPAAYVNNYGAGRSVYFPFAVDAAYAGTNEGPEHRLLMRNAASLAPPQRIQVNAPLNVDVEILKQEDSYIVHLLAFQQVRQAVSLPSLNLPVRPSPRMEENPTYRARLTAPSPILSCAAFSGAVVHQLDECNVELIVEDVHEALRIKLGE